MRAIPTPSRTTTVTADARFMAAALRLARRNLGQTWPNPSVGALVVATDAGGAQRIVGRGTTRRGGRPHAEVIALQDAGEAARGATCYVTLEPCNHHGRTPPCSEALIEAGVARVVTAIVDPDARVDGAGHARLRAAGIAVETQTGRMDAALLNAGHLLKTRHGRPFVTLKLAVTADGFIAGANREPLAITGGETRAHVHMMRARHDAILVGRGTVEADDPSLTCRLPGMAGLSPVRVALDRRFRMPAKARMLKEATEGGPPVWVIGSEFESSMALFLKLNGAQTLKIDAEATKIDMAQALARLAGEGITRVLIEGGAEVAGAVLADRLADEIVIVQAPKTLAELLPGTKAGLGVAGLDDLVADGMQNTYEALDSHMLGADRLTLYRRRGLVDLLVSSCPQTEVA